MNIYDWDIVYVNSNKSINNRLKKYINDNEPTFRYEDENTEINLTFENWEIVSEGSSKLLRLKTPVKKGELTFMGKRTEINGICPLLEVQLDFFKDPNNSSLFQLMFNFGIKGEKEGDQREGAITLINPDLNHLFEEGSMIYTVLKLSLSEMFITNKAKMSYIFAYVNVTPEVPWMQPKNYKYTYYHPTSNQNEGFLAVLSVVTERDISQLKDVIDGSILDYAHDNFLLLSERLFLEQIILPELPNSFGNGTTKNHFRFKGTSATSGYIHNNGNIPCGSVKWGLTNYYPFIDSLKIKIEGNQIWMKASGRCDITGLASSYITFSVETKNKFYFNRTSKKIEFEPDANPKVSWERYIPWWVWIIGIVAPIVDLIIHFVTEAVSSSVAKSIKIDANNSISYLTNSVVKWSNMEKAEISDCLLDVAFCIKGKNK